MVLFGMVLRCSVVVLLLCSVIRLRFVLWVRLCVLFGIVMIVDGWLLLNVMVVVIMNCLVCRFVIYVILFVSC